MNPLTAARAQMEVSLGFHMLFAAAGVAMPLLMVLAEGIWLRTKRAVYRDLAQTWGKATALLFAIGAVSGTALSFELGLLWPRFMAFSGAMIGPAFALEGYAFFIEAIFVGLYLYGWDKLSPRAHWLCGIPVAVSGVTSAVLVVAANAWMQVPSGFRLENGRAVDVEASAAFASPVWPIMSIHSAIACYAAVGFAVAGVYAVGLLRRRARGERNPIEEERHKVALDLALAVAAVAIVLQIVTGDFSARAVAEHEPVKLAAMESLYETERGAPLLIGGFPDSEHQEVHGAIRIPKGLSFLATGDPDAEVPGLAQLAPPGDHPSVPVTHFAFQTMVGIGFLLAAIAAFYWFVRWRYGKRDEPRVMSSGGFTPPAPPPTGGAPLLPCPPPRLLLYALAVASPLGFLALEAGWIVTEVGRQPWAVRGVLRTRDAVTPVSSVSISFFGFTVLYLALGATLVFLLRGLARRRGGEGHA